MERAAWHWHVIRVVTNLVQIFSLFVCFQIRIVCVCLDVFRGFFLLEDCFCYLDTDCRFIYRPQHHHLDIGPLPNLPTHPLSSPGIEELFALVTLLPVTGLLICYVEILDGYTAISRSPEPSSLFGRMHCVHVRLAFGAEWYSFTPLHPLLHNNV